MRLANVGSAVLLVLALGCSAAATKPKAPDEGPVGCCCTYADCRQNFTQHACVEEAEFQGWTYGWHPGACTAQDKPVLGGH